MKRIFIAGSMLLFILVPRMSFAHCDTLAGPVVIDARKALQAEDAAPVLKWVREADEAEVRLRLAEALAKRQKSENAEEAEMAFFESVVKLHRLSEGESFTGLKPAESIEPFVAAADRAIDNNSVAEVESLVIDEIVDGINERFEKVMEKKEAKDKSIEEGRQFVKAYVEFLHYIENLSSSFGHKDHH